MGNFFRKIATLEDIARDKEAHLEVNPIEDNRQDLKTVEESLKQYYKLEEEYWKQKAGMQWFKESDRNTKFFHNYVKVEEGSCGLMRLKCSRVYLPRH